MNTCHFFSPIIKIQMMTIALFFAGLICFAIFFKAIDFFENI